jgi:hypothetical protein
MWMTLTTKAEMTITHSTTSAAQNATKWPNEVLHAQSQAQTELAAIGIKEHSRNALTEPEGQS